MKSGRLILLVAALLAGPCGAAFGQATNAGDISGIVTDTTGAAVPGATVMVLNVETGVTKNTPQMMQAYTTRPPLSPVPTSSLFPGKASVRWFDL